MSTQATRIESDHASAARPLLIGFLAVQILIGYEWFISGLTKVVRGGFSSGLAAELREKSEGTAAVYKSFLDGTVIPHAVFFGYVVEIGELLVGVALIAAALIWIFRWERLPRGGRSAVLLVTAFASLAGILMNVNFHLYNGAPHPWLLPQDGFDEGVDLDSLMPVIEVALFAVSAWLWLSLRRRKPLVVEGRRRSVAEGERQPAAV